MTDKPNPSKMKEKKRTFPILNFANLLDEFLAAHSEIDVGESILSLKGAVSDALLEHVKSRR